VVAFNKKNLEKLHKGDITYQELISQKSGYGSTKSNVSRPKSVLSRHHANYAKLFESKTYQVDPKKADTTTK